MLPNHELWRALAARFRPNRDLLSRTPTAGCRRANEGKLNVVLSSFHCFKNALCISKLKPNGEALPIADTLRNLLWPLQAFCRCKIIHFLGFNQTCGRFPYPLLCTLFYPINSTCPRTGIRLCQSFPVSVGRSIRLCQHFPTSVEQKQSKLPWHLVCFHQKQLRYTHISHVFTKNG